MGTSPEKSCHFGRHHRRGGDIGHEDITYKLPGYDAYPADNDPTPNGNDAQGTARGCGNDENEKWKRRRRCRPRW